MKETDELKSRAIKLADSLKEELREIARYLKENPEIGFSEFKATELITTKLKDHGFEVNFPLRDIPTSFIAVHKDQNPEMNIAFMLEYDALPDIGHGCGHNLIAAMGYLAAVVSSKLGLPAEIAAVGCPGEENFGGKVVMASEGLFDRYDVAMLVHPATETGVFSTSNALDAIEFVYHGKEAHAAGCPEKGVNALDAVILLFNGINALREHVTSDVRIHGIIAEGGKAANVVPGKAVARFYFRAAEREYLNEVVRKALNIAKGAAMMTGAELEWNNYERSNDNFMANKPLSEIFKENLVHLGENNIRPPKEGFGSTDAGNVSHRVPTIHPYIAICDKDEFTSHTRELANHTVSDQALDKALLATKAMVLTAIDLAYDTSKLENIKKAFEGHKS